MSDKSPRAEGYALFATRILIAAIFLWHGVPKAIDAGAAIDKFIGFGLPGFLGPVTGVVEVIAAGLLLGGVLPRTAALVLAVIILGAIVTVQLPAGITAGLERDLLILVGTALLIAHGPGPFRFGSRTAGTVPME